MEATSSSSLIAFDGHRLIGCGAPANVALMAKAAIEADRTASVLIFDAENSRRVEFDLRGTDEAVLARIASLDPTNQIGEGEGAIPGPEDSTRKPGRPKLGVVAREVTLLPRHWDWLANQPGGASIALRKLVEAARRDGAEKDRLREATESTYRFLSQIGGDLPGFEEVSRALFAHDRERFVELIDDWPHDVREHAIGLLNNGFADTQTSETLPGIELPG